MPCDPFSEFVAASPGGPDLGLCAEASPEFAHRGGICCPKHIIRRRRATACDPKRAKSSYCDERSASQREYAADAASGKLGDLMAYLSRELARPRREQAYCSVNEGFLVAGREIVPMPANRLQLRNAKRCVDYGTDEMAAMLEWVGRQVASAYPGPAYSGVRLVVGDVSAPRGGCLSGRRGRRGHASHTSGQDVDIGYLTVKSGRDSPPGFHRQFDARTNWWLIKQFFANPYVCTKVIFLDRRWIRLLPKAAAGDPAWPHIRSFIRHVRGHRDHLHVRIGNGPGQPGCNTDIENEVNLEEEGMPNEQGLDPVPEPGT
jgi:murein endopeptidase